MRYTIDTALNGSCATITDTQSGRSVFLQGPDADTFLRDVRWDAPGSVPQPVIDSLCATYIDQLGELSDEQAT